MSMFRTSLIRLMAVLLAFALFAEIAVAACEPFDGDRLSELEKDEISEVQLGLRSAYRDDNGLLRDGKLGAYTRQRLQDLCTDVPRTPGLDELSATLSLTTEYATMQRFWPDWSRDLVSLSLPGPPALGLRLAGTIPMKTLAIGRRAETYDCAAPVEALASVPNGARAFGVLTRIYSDKSAEEICRLLPVAGGVTDWQVAMDRLGQIASGRRAGALQILQDPNFLRWVEAEADSRLRRLVGTVPAVLALLDEYAVEGAPVSGATNYRSGPCTPAVTERTLTYYSLDLADVDSLDFLVSLTPKLEAFKAESGGFDSPQALWRSLRPVLAEDLDACILSQIEGLVKGPDRLALAFLLKPSATEALMADKALETARPVMTELAPVRTATKAELIERIRASLADVQQSLLTEQVTAAADTLAAASEPVPPVTDTPLQELEDISDQPATTPVMTVTDAADEAVATVVRNPDLNQALRNTPIADAAVPELIRSQVRAGLEATAAQQIRETVDLQIARIEPAVSSEWRLTEALMSQLLALPYVEAMTADATADGAKDRLLPLIGVSYPSLRLFDDALRTVSQAPGKVQFSPFVIERIVQKAQKTVDDPQSPRHLGPLQIEDCKCVPARKSEDLTVYGFYPFWLAPKREDTRLSKSTEPDGPGPEEEATGSTPQVQTLVDFGVVDRIAFYGLEFREDDNGRVILFNRERWQESRQSFVDSAHRFRARADVAFDLRNWKDWDTDTIENVVADIAAELAPFPRLASYELDDLRQAIPTLFDHPQPDGVTLIFHDYDGVRLGKKEMSTMIRIIKSTYEALPNRDRLHINVAFDFDLVETTTVNGQTEFKPILDEPVFDDLFELLQVRPYVLAEDSQSGETPAPAAERESVKVIHKILLFLERPTTDAKKGLRFRMEQGLFQGELRRQVLRSIIPVLPPAGHREIRTLVKPNDPNQSERPPFSQFEDDVVYFKDNFSGIGFWPLPDPIDPATSDETAALFRIVSTHFNAPLLPPQLAGFTAPLERVCTIACPNRAFVALGAILVFAAIVLMTWRSFYSGLVDKIAFRLMGVGAVWIGNLAVLMALLILSTCDPLAFWPGVLWKILGGMLITVMIYNFFHRLRNGPMP